MDSGGRRRATGRMSPLTRIKDWVHRTTLLENAVAHARTIAARGKHPLGIVPDVPRRVIVEPTNACNLKCAYCGNKAMFRPRTFLDFELYRRLLDEMVELGIPRLTLHTVGEPTLHPRLPEMLRMATDRRRVVTISTNATRLDDEDYVRELVRAGPEILNVSADAGDTQTLAKTRDGLTAERVISALKLLRRLRDEEGPVRDSPWGRVRLPTLTVTCVLTPLFTREVERRFFEAYAPLVDDFLFHVPNNHAEKVPDEPFYLPGLLPKRWRDRVYKAVRHPCNYPWDALFLLSDGTMSVCRFDFDAQVTVGRFGPQSIHELWTSDLMNDLRRSHMDFDFRNWPQCENCSATWYENRHEHRVATRRYMERNGVHATRDAWLPADPLRTGGAAAAARAAAARGGA